MNVSLVKSLIQAKLIVVPYDYRYKIEGEVDRKQLNTNAQPHFDVIVSALNEKTTDDTFKRGVELVLQELTANDSPFALKRLDGNSDLMDETSVELSNAVSRSDLTESRKEVFFKSLSRGTNFHLEYDEASSSDFKKITELVAHEGKPKVPLAKAALLSKFDVVFKNLAEKIIPLEGEDFREAVVWISNHYSHPNSDVSTKRKWNNEWSMDQDFSVAFISKFAD